MASNKKITFQSACALKQTLPDTRFTAIGGDNNLKNSDIYTTFGQPRCNRCAVRGRGLVFGRSGHQSVCFISGLSTGRSAGRMHASISSHVTTRGRRRGCFDNKTRLPAGSTGLIHDDRKLVINSFFSEHALKPSGR